MTHPDLVFVTSRTRHHERSRVAERLEGLRRGLEMNGIKTAIITSRWWPQSTRLWHARHDTHYTGGDGALRAGSVARRLIELRPSAILAIDTRPAVTLTVGGVAAAIGARFAYEATGFKPPLTRSGTLQRRIHRLLDAVIAPSETVATQLRADGVTVKPTVVPDPIDADLIERVVPDERFDIVWVAPDAAAADLDTLVLGLAELRDLGWQAVVIDPANPNGVERQARDLGLADRIDVVSRSTRRARVALYRGAHVFVETAPVCPYPTELLWAMASGCVGIVQYREHSSAHELIEAYGRGERISTPDALPDALAAASERPYAQVHEPCRYYDIEQTAERLVASLAIETV